MIKIKFPKIKLTSRQWTILLVVWGLLILVGIGLISYKFFYNPVGVNENSNLATNLNVPLTKVEFGPCFRRKIDGVCEASEINTNLYPVAVMIENMVDAWPLSGLDQANLVFEAPVEGGITRFSAFYASGEPVAKIGPIRSARPYYLDWAEELRALYLHVGGSPEALAKIKNYDIYDLNQFFNDRYFWRDRGRLAPHNVYTSSELINQALTAKNLKEVAYESWLYKDDADPKDRPAQVKDLVIDFSTPAYRATWKYDPATNSYLRYQGDQPQTMLNGAEVRAKNIAVQIAKIQIVDDYSRRKIWTVGQGQALIFEDGKVISGQWKKDGRGARTKFYDANNQEIEFNAGTTWVEVVPDITSVSY